MISTRARAASTATSGVLSLVHFSCSQHSEESHLGLCLVDFAKPYTCLHLLQACLSSALDIPS